MRARLGLCLGSVVWFVVACSSSRNDSTEIDAGVDASQSAAEIVVVHPVLSRATMLAGKDRQLAASLAPNVDGLRDNETKSGFVSSGFVEATNPNHLGALLPKKGDGAWRVGPARIERLTTTLSPIGARPVEATIDQGRLFYEGAWPSTDVVVATGRRGMEWLLVLRDREAPTSFAWDAKLGSGLHPRPGGSPDGAIELLDEHDTPTLRIDPAFAVDAKGTRRAVSIALRDGALHVDLDAKGLEYPILIDPLVSVPAWTLVGYFGYSNGATMSNLGASSKLLLAGGGIPPLSTASVFDTSAWSAFPSMTSTRFRTASATVNGKMYVFGGCTASNCTTLNPTMDVADPGTSTWSTFCDTTTCFTGGFQYNYAGPGLAAIGNQLLEFGGANTSGGLDFGVDNRTFVLDLGTASHTFTELSPSPSPNGRFAHAFVGATSANVAFLFGGSPLNLNAPDGDTWLWTKTGPTSGTWACACDCGSLGIPPCANQPTPRNSVGAAWDSVRKRFVVMGGYARYGDGNYDGRGTWDFDPVSKTYAQLCADNGPDVCALPAASGLSAAFDPVHKAIIASTNGGGTWQLIVRGGACSTGADCDTGYCVESTCCTTSSCPVCQTCADPSSTGVCTNVAAGVSDPLGRCPSGGQCNGSGACKPPLGSTCATGTDCASGNCVNSTCCTTSSCGVGLTCADPAGSCKKIIGQTCATSTECASGSCVDGVCCSVASCGTGGHCNYPTAPGSCLKDNAQACTAGTQCGSGYCVDGWCCNGACNGQCAACDIVRGTCTPVTGAPHGMRTACAGTGACQSTCNGSDSAACHYPGATISCGSASCTGSTVTATGTCNGAGGCNQPTSSCGAYVCGAASCKTSCTANTDCIGGYYCKAGTCSPKDSLGASCTAGGAAGCASGFCVDGVCCSTSSCTAGLSCNLTGSLGKCAKPKGVACASSAECGTGFCVDGVCCDTGCTGQCQACDGSGSVGTCKAIAGVPHGTRAACVGSGGECGAVCDGTDGTTCHYPTGTKSCGANTCVSLVATHVSVCNSKGACSDIPATCGSYQCNPTACKTSCTTNVDCTVGNYCKSGACIPIEGLGTSCTTASTCTSGFCTDGVCCAVGSCGAGKSCSAGTTKGVCTGLSGTSCKANGECASGACVDGVCCDGKCDGPCEACNQPGSIGKCIPIVGMPVTSHPPCSASSTDPACGLRCDGTDGKKCNNAAPTVACGTPSCEMGIEQQVSTCDGGGTCKPASKACGAYACGPTACLTTCVTTVDCSIGSFCKDGSCIGAQGPGEKCADATQCKSGFCTDGVCCTVMSCDMGSACAAGPGPLAGTCLKTKGVACTAAGDCATGHCVDGVCCDTPCDGQCEACDVKGSEGACTPVVGPPHSTRAACDSLGDTDCAKAQCNGDARDKCAGFKNGPTTACGMASCTMTKALQKTGGCDGKGSCSMPEPTSCVEYGCDPAVPACRTTCTTNDDCATDFVCDKDSSKCVQGAHCNADRTESIDKTGASSPCTPYRCGTDGRCGKQCGTTDDCAPGSVCDSTTLACVVVQTTTADSGGGCGCATPGQGNTGRSVTALGLLLAGLVGVRRKRRRAE
ncbi:MAG: MYXO-CTERM sorting domain-containing protein [Polyangiales bacterium]